MRLQRLTGLERKKIDDEYIDVMETIDWLESVLADEQKVFNIIKEDLLEMKKKFGDARRTILSHDTSSMDMEDLIAEEDIVIRVISNVRLLIISVIKNAVVSAKPVAAARKMTIVQSICSCRQLIIIFFSLPIKVVFIGKKAMKFPKLDVRLRERRLSICCLLSREKRLQQLSL